MKVTIDTTNKTITLLENITVKDFIDNVKILSSYEDFDNYTIINNEKFITSPTTNPNPWINPYKYEKIRTNHPFLQEPYTSSC